MSADITDELLDWKFKWWKSQDPNRYHHLFTWHYPTHKTEPQKFANRVSEKRSDFNNDQNVDKIELYRFQGMGKDTCGNR